LKNKNNIIVFTLAFFVFLPNLLFLILSENNIINSEIKQLAFLAFTISLILFPLVFIRAKVYFGLMISLIPFLFFDMYFLLITKNHSTSLYYASIFNTNMSESKEFIVSNMAVFLTGIFGIVSYFFLWFKLDMSYRITFKNRIYILIFFLFVIGALSIKIYTLVLNNRRGKVLEGMNTTFNRNYIQRSFPFGAVYKLSKLYVIEKSLNEFNKKNKYFSYKPKILSDKNQTILLVLGESARRQNFQLNGYDRKTNPILSKEKNLIVYKEVTTNSNFTYSSISLILSSVNPKNFSNRLSELGITYAFKESGFDTYWLTNQQYNEDVICKLYSSQSDYFKDVSTLYDENLYDENLLSNLKKILKDKNKKRFIVLHTMGSHFNYNKRYPKFFSKYLPDLKGSISMNKKNILKNGKEIYVNSYDNSILYTDYILASVIKELKKIPENSIMLYISDHGENLYDDDKGMILHGGMNPTKYELEIPMLVWYSEGYNKEVIDNLSSYVDNKISSLVIFHTLSSLGGFQTKFHQNRFDLLSDSLQVGNRLFYIDEEKVINIDN